MAMGHLPWQAPAVARDPPIMSGTSPQVNIQAGSPWPDGMTAITLMGEDVGGGRSQA